MVSLEFDLQIPGAIDRTRERLSDLSVPLEQFGQRWRDVFSTQQFNKQETADGKAWKTLNPSYVNWKSRKNYHLEIGKRTLAMFLSRGYERQRDSIRLEYLPDYSKHFDAYRPLFSSDGSLPLVYKRELHRLITEYLSKK